jgi:RNA polymerase sigma-70 factor (ECF subfamily)
MLAAERNRVFESWIDAHKAILIKVARVYGATHSDREDLFQEIALQVWHSVEAYRGDCAATTWIYRRTSRQNTFPPLSAGQNP